LTKNLPPGSLPEGKQVPSAGAMIMRKGQETSFPPITCAFYFVSFTGRYA